MSANLESGSKPYDILILSNGPGELTTWVRPVVLELRQQMPEARISLMLSHCPHASGQEVQLASTFIGVDRIQDVDAFWRFFLTGTTEEAWDWSRAGVVVFLGGDQVFGIWAASILGYRVVVYAEHEPRWRIWVDAFAVRTEGIKQKYKGWPLGRRWDHKMHVIGDLMMDGVASATYLPGLPIPGWSSAGIASTVPQPRPEPATTTMGASITELYDALDVNQAATVPEPHLQRIQDAALLPRGWQRLTEKGSNRYQIALLPGSKAAKLSLGVPLFLAVADEIRQLVPNVTFVIPVAPTVSAHQMAAYAQAKTNYDISLVYGTTAVLEQTNLGSQFVTPFGTIVRLWTSFPAYSVLANCDLCITTIGANTAELTRLATPMLVVLPLNKPDAMRAWDGLPGILTNLPVVGTWFAKIINKLAMKLLGLLAWPNILAGEEVVPEIRGHLTPIQIAEMAAALLKNEPRREQMRDRLQQIAGQPGAAQAMVDIIKSQLARAKPRMMRPARSAPSNKPNSSLKS